LNLFVGIEQGETILKEHEQKWIRLEQHLGFSVTNVSNFDSQRIVFISSEVHVIVSLTVIVNL